MKHLIAISILLAACHASTGPVAPSTPDLAARRAQMLAWLHDYEQRGQFPQDAQGNPLSVFRDARGVRCPMAELIFRSGHGDLVDEVAKTHNDLRLADVHSGPLHAWITESGLTQEEVEMIQGAMNYQVIRGEDGKMQVVEVDVFRAEALKQADAWGQVKGHLATAEVALKNATPASLRLAQTRRAPETRPASKQILETMR